MDESPQGDKMGEAIGQNTCNRGRGVQRKKTWRRKMRRTVREVREPIKVRVMEDWGPESFRWGEVVVWAIENMSCPSFP